MPTLAVSEVSSVICHHKPTPAAFAAAVLHQLPCSMFTANNTKVEYTKSCAPPISLLLLSDA